MNKARSCRVRGANPGRGYGRQAKSRDAIGLPKRAGEVGACAELGNNMFTLGKDSKAKDADQFRKTSEAMALYIGTKYGEESAREFEQCVEFVHPIPAVDAAVTLIHEAKVLAHTTSLLCRRHVADTCQCRQILADIACRSLRHRRGPDIPNLYQLLPTSTNQPKHSGTLAIIEFLCLSSNNNHEIPALSGIPRHVVKIVSFGTPGRHDIFLCLRHDQRRVATCRRHDINASMGVKTSGLCG